MPRLFVAAMAVIALLLLLLPPWAGRAAEQRLRELARALDAQPGQEVEILEYRRGWFRSRIRLRTAPPEVLAEDLDARVSRLRSRAPDPAAPASASAADALIVSALARLADFYRRGQVLDVRLRHGPLPFGGAVTAGLADARVRTDREAFGDPRIDFGITFGGQVRYALALTPDELRTDGPEIATLRFDGLSARGRLAGRAPLRASLALDAPGFTLLAEDTTLRVQGLQARARDLELREWGTLGTLAAGVDEIVAGRDDGTTAIFSARGLSVRGGLEPAQDDTLELRGEYAFDALTSERGPELTAARFGLALTGLSEALVRDWIALMGSGDPPRGTDGPGYRGARLRPLAARALASGLRLRLEPVAVLVDGEPLDGALRVVVEGVDGRDDRALDPATWLRRVRIDGRLRTTPELARTLTASSMALTLAARAEAEGRALSDAALRAAAEAQAGMVLGQLTAQGFLRDEGEGLITELEVRDGRISINGQVLPFRAGAAPGVPALNAL